MRTDNPETTSGSALLDLLDSGRVIVLDDWSIGYEGKLGRETGRLARAIRSWSDDRVENASDILSHCGKIVREEMKRRGTDWSLGVFRLPDETDLADRAVGVEMLRGYLDDLEQLIPFVEAEIEQREADDED